ncbi:cupin domain-containing protein [Segnochrobactrum spirostomi]|uniref:Cupin domain-containing protein n=1 Tax=Segnochrobactrum spirostomi TaxID=2608987 RepID=A0A6A7Y1A9_9HYPH|nr:cupin domain-containing protein [Segnochrobactrum spirostomi]MQT12535.1 cupin domain-containing protein [Segnochrobactrum spirostomi]
MQAPSSPTSTIVDRVPTDRYVAETRWMLGHRVTPLHTIGDFALLEVVSDPQVPGPPPHLHEDCSEFFYIVEGTLTVIVDGAARTLAKGESASIPAGALHTFINEGDRPTTFVTGFSPKGMERMFVDFGVPVERPDARAQSVAPDLVGRLLGRAADYGMVFPAA